MGRAAETLAGLRGRLSRGVIKGAPIAANPIAAFAAGALLPGVESAMLL